MDITHIPGPIAPQHSCYKDNNDEVAFFFCLTFFFVCVLFFFTSVILYNYITFCYYLNFMFWVFSLNKIRLYNLFYLAMCTDLYTLYTNRTNNLFHLSVFLLQIGVNRNEIQKRRSSN